jgi:integrase
MKQIQSPLQKALEARVRLLETTLQPSTMYQYRHTVRLFLGYLKEQYPGVSRPAQLRRDPHLLGWLEYLWKRRTPAGQPLGGNTRGQYVLRLRTLLDLLADFPQPPAPGLLRGHDVPPRQHRLPRPLTPEDDARLQQHWSAATDVFGCALLLQRLSGMRIGECVDLAPDCLRHLGDNRWSLHVPHGKPRSERLVPVDDRVRVAIERLAFLRTLPPAADPRFLLPRPKGRAALLLVLRKTLSNAARTVGIKSHIVPHQLRHTYATSMVRAGVSLPALMKLLGHHNANMTLLYVEVVQQDLQRE